MAVKLICGGQSGVDRAVLDVAIACGLPYGGWCPRGGWAEDFPQPPGLCARYGRLVPTPLADPAQRTAWNVRDAHACMILLDAGGLSASAGTALAQELAARAAKPLVVLDLGAPAALPQALSWLHRQLAAFGPAFALAVGGPRESEVPGIYDRASGFLRALLAQLPR